MAADASLLDTNVLLEATDERRRCHADAVALLESIVPLTLSAQIIREYLAVATRPVTANGLGMPMADALANVRHAGTRRPHRRHGARAPGAHDRVVES